MTGELRGVRRLLTGLLILQVIVAVYFAKDVLLPIVLGLLVALTLSPIVRRAARFNVPAPVAAAVLIGALGASLVIGALTLGDSVRGWVDEAPTLGERLKERLSSLTESMEAVKEATKEVEELANGQGQAVQRVVIDQPGLLNAAVSNAAGAGTSIAVGLVLALFLLSSGTLFYLKLIQSFSSFRDKKNALQMIYELERRISRYLLTITAINAAVGAAVACLAFAVGLPYAPIWGVVAFLLNFLPYLGTIVGTTLFAAVSLVTFDDLGVALLAPALYLAIGLIEGQIVTPAIVGRRLEINSVSVLLAVIFWGWLWGVAGALVAVPFLVVIKVVCDNFEALRPFGNFLGAAEEA